MRRKERIVCWVCIVQVESSDARGGRVVGMGTRRRSGIGRNQQSQEDGEGGKVWFGGLGLAAGTVRKKEAAIRKQQQQCSTESTIH